MDSILLSIKKMLGITEDYQYFDSDIILHINSVFSILNQLGVGPENGFSISDQSTTWTDYIDDLSKLEMIKTYVYMKVRMMFDPPLSSPVSEAIKNTITELEWRLNIAVDPKEVIENE